MQRTSQRRFSGSTGSTGSTVRQVLRATIRRMRREIALARQVTTWTAALAIAVLFTLVTTPLTAQQGTAAPLFKVDPNWPLEMPNHWIMGAVTGVFVDARQHVWVTHLPETLTEEELYEEQKPPMGTCCKAAPPVLEFDQLGKLVQGWGQGIDDRLFHLAARPARHLRRSPRQRLGRQLQPAPRDEVHAGRQAPAHAWPVREDQRQRRHHAAWRPLGHLGGPEDQ